MFHELSNNDCLITQLYDASSLKWRYFAILFVNGLFSYLRYYKYVHQLFRKCLHEALDTTFWGKCGFSRESTPEF